MKNGLKKIVYILMVPLVALVLVLLPAFQSDAATLTAAYIMLNRMKGGLTSTDNIEMYIALTPSGAVASGGTLTLEFPDADDGLWCRTAGSDITVAGVASTPADSTGNYDIDASLPGTLSANCTVGSSGTVDTVTITGLTGLTGGTTYGVKISNGTTAKLGTAASGSHIVVLTVTQGTTIETKSFGLNLVAEDQVTVSATVVDVQTVTCSISTSSVNLGNLYKGGSYVIGSHTINTATSSSASGYFWAAYGRGDSSTNAGLYDGSSYLIDSDNSATTVDITAPGSEGFGMNVTPGTGAVAGTGYDNATNGPGVYGSLGMGASEAELILYQIGAQASGENATITYGARAGASAAAAAYTEVVTFVCGGYF